MEKSKLVALIAFGIALVAYFIQIVVISKETNMWLIISITAFSIVYISFVLQLKQK